MAICTIRRSRKTLNSLPLTLNSVLIGLGVFILLAMSVVVAVFEEFTAFTDYTQQWIEFNFFIYYWDKLTISRVYLSFIFIYGAVIIAVSAMQIHGIRKKDLNFLHLAPLILIFIAIVTLLGAISWLIVTAVNYNEGFLATGGFIFERMRFKGNVWKDLIFREQSFLYVTHNNVPTKGQILRIWAHQRERDFSCCGWNNYLDYAVGNYTDLPESCCQRKFRVYGCAHNFTNIDRTAVINLQGCKDVMYSWYRSGFAENIVMALIGVGIAAFEFYLYSLNRKEYFKLLDEYDDMRKPMMNTTMSMSTIHSKAGSCVGSNGAHGGLNAPPMHVNAGHTINFGPHPVKYQPRNLSEQQHTPSMGSTNGLIPQMSANKYVNPLQNIQNISGRFNRPKTFNNVNSPAERANYNEQEPSQEFE